MRNRIAIKRGGDVKNRRKKESFKQRVEREI